VCHSGEDLPVVEVLLFATGQVCVLSEPCFDKNFFLADRRSLLFLELFALDSRSIYRTGNGITAQGEGSISFELQSLEQEKLKKSKDVPYGSIMCHLMLQNADENE